MIIETVKMHGTICVINGNISVPNDPANTDYQAILDWINEGNTPNGPDVIEPDYVALRTGVDGYASTGEQLGMIADGTQAAHVTDVKTRFPKTITGGTTIGEVPQDILEAAATKLATRQLEDYTTAISRLAQYQLSVGRAEVIESQATGEQVYNEETFEMDDIMVSVVVVSAIEALEATVEVTTQEIYEDPVTETIDNPLIIKDNAERAAAQEIVDTTPTKIKQHVVENT